MSRTRTIKDQHGAYGWELCMPRTRRSLVPLEASHREIQEDGIESILQDIALKHTDRGDIWMHNLLLFIIP